jgi:predicted nucleotidyltransferase
MSRTSSVQRFLDEAAQKLAGLPDVETVILYGSHAWGSPDENSDVDLLVVADTDGGGPSAGFDSATCWPATASVFPSTFPRF